jgi:hypothetical protein
MQQRAGKILPFAQDDSPRYTGMSFDLGAENAYCAVPLPRLSFSEIFPEEFWGYSA